MTQTTQPTHHFFASSIAQWATTTPTRDLRQLMKMMDKDGYSYNLFLVPCDYGVDYDIKMYQPQVEGAQWLGYFQVKEK